MSSPEAQRSRTPERPTRLSGRPGWPQARTAVVECVVLAVACLITYWLVTSALTRVYSVSRDDDLLGGMWAVLATIFVLRDSFGKSVAAGVSRMAPPSVSFVLCLICLAFLPFHPGALALLVGASALAVMLLGRPGDAVTAGITTAVIMVVAAVSPQNAWRQPILRLVDTVVGVAVGVVAAWAGIQVKRFLSARSVPPAPPKAKIDLSERAMVRGPRIRLPPPDSLKGAFQRWEVEETMAEKIQPQDRQALAVADAGERPDRMAWHPGMPARWPKASAAC